jgi:SAM-dependent methyltransferase
VLRPTGERVIPAEQREELVYAEHIARYRFACQFAPGCSVLDAGSGEGYGTAMLKDAGSTSVVGLDLDEEAVAHARERYGLDFVRGDIAELPFEDGSFDLVVCFETIEHIADGAAAVAEFRRVLTAEGLLVISTPNSKEYLVHNEFHEREYTPGEFDELLAGEFGQRFRIYQQNWLLSAVLDDRQLTITDPAQSLAVEVSKAVAVEPGSELYSIVVCGAPVREIKQFAVATGVFEAQRLSSELDGWQERAAKAEQLLAPWQERAKKAEELLAPWQERAEKAERQRQEWEVRATIAEGVSDERERQLLAMERSFSWRITRPLRAFKALVRR